MTNSVSHFPKIQRCSEVRKGFAGQLYLFCGRDEKKVKNSYKIRKKVEHENRRHTLIHEDLLHNMTLKKWKIVEI